MNPSPSSPAPAPDAGGIYQTLFDGLNRDGRVISQLSAQIEYLTQRLKMHECRPMIVDQSGQGHHAVLRAESDWHKLLNELDESQENYKQASLERDRRGEEIVVLKARLESASKVFADQMEQIGTLRHQIGCHRENQSQWSEKFVALERQLAESREETKHWRDREDQVQRKNATLSDEIKEVKKTNTRLREELLARTQTLGGYMDENRSLTAQLAEPKAYHERIMLERDASFKEIDREWHKKMEEVEEQATLRGVNEVHRVYGEDMHRKNTAIEEFKRRLDDAVRGMESWKKSADRDNHRLQEIADMFSPGCCGHPEEAVGLVRRLLDSVQAQRDLAPGDRVNTTKESQHLTPEEVATIKSNKPFYFDPATGKLL